MATQKFFGTAPFFLVPDIYKAAAFYEQKLGFSHGGFWGDPISFCIPSRGEQSIMLKQVKHKDDIRPNEKVLSGTWDAYFWVADVQGLFEEFQKKEVEMVYEPTILASYEMKEFAIRDLNGYVLAFGQNWENRDG